MNEKEIADKIKMKCTELSDLTYDAAEMGLSVDIDIRHEEEIGIRGEFVLVIPRIRKVQEL